MSLHNTQEYERLQNYDSWQLWGSYVSNRAWGVVRENYHPTADAWLAFPFDHARSRAYRWTEDGIGGFSDHQQRLCMAVALWNGQDPILKERFYGLSNQEGNHGEDVKDYYFYLDGLPTFSYMKMLYKYPQVEFPYQRLRQENDLRKNDEREFELVNVLEHTFSANRTFDVFIEYAKASPHDILCRITAVNQGQEAAPLHILPTLWYRNTWSWQENAVRPRLRQAGTHTIQVEHPDFQNYHWYVESDFLFTENETNLEKLYDLPNDSLYVKDGIEYAVVRGQQHRVNPAGEGSKCAAHLVSTLEAGKSFTVRTRFSPEKNETPWADFDAIFEQRQHEADEFYSALQSEQPTLSPEGNFIQRTALGGLGWNRNFYQFNVKRWLEGDARYKAPHREQYKTHQDWQHFDAHDILSQADTWEYPWLAAWDLAFQVVTLAIVNPTFAKQQLELMVSERYMRSDGAMAAFEGDFTTPHPPLFAWAAWHIYQQTKDKLGHYDLSFLRRAYNRLDLHFQWWLNTHCHDSYLFSGGFMGMDNISLLDRNQDIPEDAWLAQADSTGWMGLFAINMLSLAVELGDDDAAVKYLDHALKISQALSGLWDADDQFYYDVLHLPDGKSQPLKVRSLVGIVPVVAATLIQQDSLKTLPRLQQRLQEACEINTNGCYLISLVPRDNLAKLIHTLFDPNEFYSPFGIRSVSRYHKDHPVKYKLGDKEFELHYMPSEAASNMFGGNSNWRGPIWTPINHMVIEALHYYHQFYGDSFNIPLADRAHNLVHRLLSLFERDSEGHRPLHGDTAYFQNDPHWHQLIWFYEHFDAETGRGLGASHQNGWTALIAKLLHDEGKAIFVPNPERGNGS